jgi:toxin-antitoxin system PIN domain toxin
LSRAEYLPDVNVLIALLQELHVHHRIVTAWFNAPGIEWALCAFTEAGYLRNATAPRFGKITMVEATRALHELRQHQGYRYLPITADWEELSVSFSKRLYGTNQVTDAYLLGLAVRENLVLVTMDRGVLHLAGAEHRKHVLLLGTK